jgi:ATP-dependent DNA helicase RecQ
VYQALLELSQEGRAAKTSQVQERSAPVAKTKTRVALQRLQEAGIVREHRAGTFNLVYRDLRDAQLAHLASEWQQRDRRDREKLDRMEAYARTALCRWRVLRDYFGEDNSEERCGVCDNCRRGLAQRAEAAERAEGAERAPSPTSPPKFTAGDRVSLPKFGDGTVQEVDGDSIVVRFSGGRARKFKSEFAQRVRRSTQNR